jgi:competence protein ComEC
MSSRLRLPPLACAIALAAILALRGRPAPELPAGASADDRQVDRITGTVRGPIIAGPHGVGAPLDTGATTVWIWSPTRVEPGQRIEVSGRLRTPRGYLDPGASDRAALAASRGADWEMSVDHVEVIGEDDGLATMMWRHAARIQTAWSSRISGEEPAASALRGIVTGDRANVPEALDQRWRIAGIYHVLSVSGLHLAVVAGLAFALLRRLVAASPLGRRARPARFAAPLALVLAIIYTAVTGAQLATVRSLAVVTIALVGQMLDRPVRLVDALGAAAIAILAWRPADLFDPSFQLSFVAALTLALLPRRARTGSAAAHWLRTGIATSAWVAITTAPLTALHFHQVAPGGVIGNLVLTPLVELVALPVGFAGVLLGDLGAPLVAVAVWLVGRVDALAGVLACVMPVGTIAIGSAIVMAGLVALSLWLSSRPRRRRGEWLAWLALCALWTLARTPPPPGALRVTFLDVGQGDAAIVELPGGEVWLVDAGGNASARTLAAASAPGTAIARTLAVYGHTSIDRAVLSHPHPDHYLGFAALDLPVRELWFADDPGAAPGRGGRIPSFAAIAAALAARGTQLVRPSLGTTRGADGVELEVWAPRFVATDGAAPVLAPDPVRGVNDNSLVFAIRYAGRTVLFAGDLEAEGEEVLVDAGLPPADVVKVAHHGSPTSSSDAFVAATHPALAVISCGVANTFGFPSRAVVERWQAAGARVARTDLDGAITVTIAADGELSVEHFAP